MADKRPKFSQRMGINPISAEFKPGELSAETRTRFWNHFLELMEITKRRHNENGYSDDVNLLREIWTGHLKQRRDHFIPKKTEDAVCDCILNPRNEPHLALDLIEFLLFESSLDQFLRSISECEIGLILEEENAAFRLYPNGFTPIHSELENNSLQNALQLPETAVSIHLRAAADFLKNKDESHIRNSIKESISAVLAAFYLICNERKDSIDEYLKLCNKRGIKVQLNKCFQLGFAKFYNWTSGEQGIRHEILEGETPPSYADAQFMLHICSAAVNMLLRTRQLRS